MQISAFVLRAVMWQIDYSRDPRPSVRARANSDCTCTCACVCELGGRALLYTDATIKASFSPCSWRPSQRGINKTLVLSDWGLCCPPPRSHRDLSISQQLFGDEEKPPRSPSVTPDLSRCTLSQRAMPTSQERRLKPLKSWIVGGGQKLRHHNRHFKAITVQWWESGIQLRVVCL